MLKLTARQTIAFSPTIIVGLRIFAKTNLLFVNLKKAQFFYKIILLKNRLVFVQIQLLIYSRVSESNYNWIIAAIMWPAIELMTVCEVTQLNCLGASARSL